jgi:hypothetical protein
LSSYGLNPAHWNLDLDNHLPKNQLTLFHRDDESFRLVATLKRTGEVLRITNLCLTSI